VSADDFADIIDTYSRRHHITMNYIPGIGRQCLVILVF